MFSEIMRSEGLSHVRHHTARTLGSWVGIFFGHGYKVMSAVSLPLLYYANGDFTFGRLQESCLPST